MGKIVKDQAFLDDLSEAFDGKMSLSRVFQAHKPRISVKTETAHQAFVEDFLKAAEKMAKAEAIAATTEPKGEVS